MCKFVDCHLLLLFFHLLFCCFTILPPFSGSGQNKALHSITDLEPYRPHFGNCKQWFVRFLLYPGMASGRGRSSRMKFFEQHTFGNEHPDPLEDDKMRVCENVSAESANIRGVAPSKISYARKRRFSDLEFVQDEGTSIELQRFDDEAIGVGEVSKDPELCSEADMRNVRSSSRGQALYQRSRQGVLTKYNDDGDDEFQCIYCDANFWLPEANKRNKRNAPIIYTGCCQNGRVKLEHLKPTPAFLEELLNPINGRERILFRQNIRVYNLMFAYTSMGAKIDHNVNIDGSALYVFKICGQVYHRMGSILPLDGESSRYAQLYIYDT